MIRLCNCRRMKIVSAGLLLSLIAVIPAHAQIQPATPPKGATASAPPDNTGLHLLPCPSTAYSAGAIVTNSIHWHRFERAMFSWQTIAGPAVSTSFSQWATSHKGYGSDPNAWGYHFGIDVAGNVSGKFLSRYAGPAIFRQDDAYQPLGSGYSTKTRIGHILSHLVLTQSADHTHRVFNVSAMPASAVNTGLQNLYEPHARRTVVYNLEGFALSLAGFAAGDAYQEYRCAIHRLIPGHRHHDLSAPSNP